MTALEKSLIRHTFLPENAWEPDDGQKEKQMV